MSFLPDCGLWIEGIVHLSCFLGKFCAFYEHVETLHLGFLREKLSTSLVALARQKLLYLFRIVEVRSEQGLSPEESVYLHPVLAFFFFSQELKFAEQSRTQIN